MAGASYDIVVLSSSPPAHDLYAPSSPLNGSPPISLRRVAMPASPLVAYSAPVSPKKTTLGASTHGPRRADIPPDAIRGFATVGSLVRSEHFAQPFDDDTTGKERVRSRRGSCEDVEGIVTAKKKPNKRSVPVSVGGGDAKPKPKPRARKPKTADKEATIPDPELRLPPPKVSPFFAAEGIEPAIDPPPAPADIVPKLTKSGKPRKPRAKKEEEQCEDVAAEPKKTRATKPKAAKAVGKLQRQETCVQSAHFRHVEVEDGHRTADPLAGHEPIITKDVVSGDTSVWEIPQSPEPKKKRAPKPRAPGPVIESLELDEAVSRRRDWTPPRDTTIASPFTDSAGKENKQTGPGIDNGQFTHMVSNFTYAQALPAQIASTVADLNVGRTAVTKRRRVELVDVPGNTTTSRNSSPEKGKAPKKKPRTITDIATERYQSKTVPLDPSEVASEFFQPRTTVMKVPLNDASEKNSETSLKKSSRKRSTSKPTAEIENVGSKTKAKKASTKALAKPKPMAEKLLSPASALVRMNKQDILFGTSSQLALEESPTLVRQIQHALKESEEEADKSLGESIAPPPCWPKLDKVIGKRSLWEASSRDIEGHLLEHMEDVYMPEFDRTQDFPLLMDGTNDKLDDVPPGLSTVDKNDDVKPVIISSDGPTPPPSESRALQTTSNGDNDVHGPGHVMNDSIFEDIDDLDCQPPPSNQNVESQNSFTDIDGILQGSIISSTSKPPKLKPPASAPLNRSPKKARGRPRKSPSTTSASNASQISISKSKTTTAKASKSASAPPATPAKSSGRFVDIDEILDSDDETMQALSPTPPRVRNFENSEPLHLFSVSPSRAKKQKTKSSVDPKIVHVHIVPSSHLEWSTFKGTVFSSITSYIRSLAPSTNPLKPSWHEKILMYDPIVLEEFTACLNADAGLRTWKRATKVQTKAWNKEMKAIGGEEVGVIEGGGDVLVVEKELEAWQVQAWCESMSVCCIWGEGRGKGGVRKGFY